jgi:GT2 family glycosyltransferase
MTEWDHLSDRQVDHVIGAFYFVRRSVFEVLNGFDEQFFVYLEDVDLSLRAKQAGWKTAYNANAQAFHQGGGTSQQVKAMRLYYILRSQLQYGFKHFTRWQSWALVGVTMFVEPVSRILFVSMRRQWDSVLDTLRGYRMLWKELANIVHSHEKG